MGKKLLSAILLISSVTTFAAKQVSQSKPELNNPAVGSRQASEQTFGEPQLTGQKGKQYYTHTQLQNGGNHSAQGSITSSNQTFGDPKLTGQKGKRYYTKEQLNNGSNNPALGSVTSSEQLFGTPGNSKSKQ
ncbi:MAG: hypothetical protein ACK4M7_08305 [Burkholderiales bacterium]